MIGHGIGDNSQTNLIDAFRTSGTLLKSSDAKTMSMFELTDVISHRVFPGEVLDVSLVC